MRRESREMSEGLGIGVGKPQIWLLVRDYGVTILRGLDNIRNCVRRPNWSEQVWFFIGAPGCVVGCT